MRISITFEPMRRIMFQQRMTGERLSQLTGHSRANISDILNDKRDARISSLCKFARVLGCTIDDLIEWEVGGGMSE